MRNCCFREVKVLVTASKGIQMWWPRTLRIKTDWILPLVIMDVLLYDNELLSLCSFKNSQNIANCIHIKTTSMHKELMRVARLDLAWKESPPSDTCPVTTPEATTLVRRHSAVRSKEQEGWTRLATALRTDQSPLPPGGQHRIDVPSIVWS